MGNDMLIVHPPERLKNFMHEHPSAFILICVQKYSEVIDQLRDMGLSDAERFAITPFARELAVIDHIRDHDATILFSNYDQEGGLYLYQIGSGEYQELATGSIRGFQRVGDFLYYVSYSGLHRLDAITFEKYASMELEEYDFCGLVYDEAQGHLIIGDTQSDRILFIDEQKLTLVKDVAFSAKCKEFGREYHHVNDLVVIGDYILASVFSVNGWWRYGMYDGGIIEVHKQTLEMRTIPIKETWFPHSLCVHDGRLYVLDSMNGVLLRDLRDVVFQTDGFLRGLEFNGRFCYIGQSLHRHVSRLSDQITISADCGFHIFDMETRLRRFIALPDMTNIYQIQVVDWLQ